MKFRRIDPSRRCLTPAEWPLEDQRLWLRACQDGSLFHDRGMAAHWAPATRVSAAKAYGRFLNYLQSTNQLQADGAPSERINPETVVAFVAQLQTQVTAVTVWSTLSRLSMVAKVMFPETDWTWFKHVVNRLHGLSSRTKPRTKRTLSPRIVWKAGIKLMTDADMSDSRPPLLRASRYRDGLMLALQAARPLRLKNLVALDIHKHLRRIGETYVLVFDAGEMKNRRAFEATMPADLTSCIDSYLGRHRPILLHGNASSALWITKQGRAMRLFSVHQRVTRLTRRLFGTSVSVHRFRHSLATGIAIERPEKVRMAMALLGHQDFATTDRHYIIGQSLAASRAHNSLLEHLKCARMEEDDK